MYWKNLEVDKVLEKIKKKQHIKTEEYNMLYEKIENDFYNKTR